MQRRLSRFDPDSELSRLNADPRERVPAGALLRRLAASVAVAGRRSGGLVDATCLPAVEAAGYRGHWTPGADFTPAPPETAARARGATSASRTAPSSARAASGSTAAGSARGSPPTSWPTR